jgi:hypothetical protein
MPRIECPHCREDFKAPSTAPGESVYCPECGEKFTPNKSDEEGISEQFQREKPQATFADEEPDRPRRNWERESPSWEEELAPRRRRRKKKKSSYAWLILTLVIVGVLVAGAAVFGVVKVVDMVVHGKTITDNDWREFSGPDKKFKVLMPGTPTRKEQAIPGLRQPMSIHVVDLNAKAFFVGYLDIPPEDFHRVPVEDRFNGAREGMLKSTPNSKVVSEKPITLDGNPGRELVVSVPGRMRLVVQIVLVDLRFYILTAVGPGYTPETADVTKFLSSFQIQKPGGGVQNRK